MLCLNLPYPKKYGGAKYGNEGGLKKYGGTKVGGKNGKYGGSKNGKNGGATGVTEFEAEEGNDVATPLDNVTANV
jgi:hypothetical protein